MAPADRWWWWHRSLACLFCSVAKGMMLGRSWNPFRNCKPTSRASPPPLSRPHRSPQLSSPSSLTPRKSQRRVPVPNTDTPPSNHPRRVSRRRVRRECPPLPATPLPCIYPLPSALIYIYASSFSTFPLNIFFLFFFFLFFF